MSKMISPKSTIMKKRLFALSSLLLLLFFSCAHPFFKSKWTREQAPAHFKARFETTKGVFEIESYREWSPLAVDRFYQLIKHKYFTNTPVYRVVPNYVAQFGNFDSLSNSHWDRQIIPDEEVKKQNIKGTVSYARSGKDTRGTQFYINLVNNSPRLDTLGISKAVVIGFPVIANVISGMDVVLSFYSYKDEPRAKLPDGVEAISFFKANFPQMDYIKKASLIK
jgi:peptidyl-prolyl cis-trans isomerase A (cyclophilin A)